MPDHPSMQPAPTISASQPLADGPCRHESTRADGTLDERCLRCGADGYWHRGHRHDKVHPSGKLLFRRYCPETPAEVGDAHA
jgi:hypothetical protein